MSAATDKSNDLSYIDANVIVLVRNAKKLPKIEKTVKYLLFIFRKLGPKIFLMHHTKRMKLERHSMMPYVWIIGSMASISSFTDLIRR